MIAANELYILTRYTDKNLNDNNMMQVYFITRLKISRYRTRCTLYSSFVQLAFLYACARAKAQKVINSCNTTADKEFPIGHFFARIARTVN